jgi:uncharacterized protein (UPF0276 family)
LAELPDVAFLEVHSENFFAPGGAAAQVLRLGAQHYPISLHGVGLSLGSAVGLDDWHLAQLARLVERTDPVRVSDHASFARAQLPAQLTGQPTTVHAADLLPVPWTHEALHTMAANVQRVQDRLRRPIAVENLSAYLAWQPADWSEPDFLTELARRTGCHLLVDVNNLMVNALNERGAPVAPDATLQASLVADCCAWLDALGAVPVAEIHLAGHVHAGDIVIDDHGSRVHPAVWTLYQHALARLGPVPTLIEWDTDLPPLTVLLEEAQSARERAARWHQPDEILLA